MSLQTVESELVESHAKWSSVEVHITPKLENKAVAALAAVFVEMGLKQQTAKYAAEEYVGVAIYEASNRPLGWFA